MRRLTLTKSQARQFILAHQGLWPPRCLAGKDGVLEHIDRVGCIQFDPLDIVGHNSELVLQARVLGFRRAILQELLYDERQLIDGYDKMMSIYSVQDWPYFGRDRESAARDLANGAEAIRSILPRVRKDIMERGPVSSIDLDYDERVRWPWGPARLARAALESMYFCGELVIHHRVHTRRVYDLAIHHLPQDLLSAPDPNVSDEEYHDWRVLRRIGGIGLLWERSGDAWLGIPGVRSRERRESLKRLLAQGKVTEVSVEGIAPTLYMRTSDEDTLHSALRHEGVAPRAAILAPLDNLLWDRRLVTELFDFDYRWEVYKPAPQRDYGYYVLPILYGDRFAARFEPARDSAGRALVIRNWWWEPEITLSDDMRIALIDCFREFLAYLESDSLTIDSQVAERSNLGWLQPN
ncbi:MAG TPA: crosslink repair DNA glycosylase YcaQ family protein [Bacillota bacterium]|jgi:hypothetical protein|nr:crosslink repair DNA glycosylase YcaQ family protein [Bacillota bacterium]